MTERSLQDFFDTLRSAQQATRAKFPVWYDIIERIDRCFVRAGENLINPKPVVTGTAYNDRGLAFAHKGDFDRANADLTQAIQIDPKYFAAYFNRGVGPKALADLTEANALNPAQPYVALALDIVAVRSGLPSSLKDASAKIDMTAWPAPVIRLYLGQLTPDATLAAADDPNAETKRGQVCEANFYTGVIDVRAGRKEDATRRFNAAASECPAAYLERMFASFELKALGGSGSKP